VELLRHLKSIDESGNLELRDLSQPPQVIKLRFSVVCRSIEPIPLSRGSMHAEGPANRIAEFLWPELILPGEDLDSVC
jgi:hypothetical protein